MRPRRSTWTCHNTLVKQRHAALGQRRAEEPLFPRLTSDLLGAFALSSEPASGSDAFALETKAEDKGITIGS
jgi:alkylation response protein AidB-like acyl-CoA dehydrogenase